MLIAYFVLMLFTLVIVVLDGSYIGLFGKTIQNYRIAGAVNDSESRRVSYLCARALNHEIDVKIIEEKHESYLVFKDELVCLDITDRFRWTFGNRMKMNNVTQESFNNKCNNGSANLSISTKKDIEEVIQYCKNNNLIDSYKSYVSISDDLWWIE
ncbi:hypothetical protein [Klebsiella phage phiKp_21]|nr:hypothetical protein [Klebsiella phage phiKp_21]